MRAGVLLAALPLVAGCAATRHTPLDPASLPAAYRNAPATTGAVREGFRPDLNDPVLGKLLARADAANTDAAAALARVAQARAVARQAGAARLPEVGAAVFAQRRQVSGVPGVAFGPRRLTLLSAELQASWEADLFGRLSAEARAARRDDRAAQADLRAVRLTVAGDVAQAYVRFRSAETRLALAQRSAATQGELARLVGSRARAGLVSQLDPARADALAAQTEATARDLVIDRETALAQLAVLVGATAAEIGPDLERSKGGLPRGSSSPSPGVPASLLLLRPDVERDLERLAAADDRKAARVRDRLPRLTIAASGGATATSVSDLLDPAARAYSLVAELFGPIIDFGRRRAIADQARAQADERAATLRGTVLTAIREVEEALAENRERGEQAARLDDALGRQRQAVRLARARYTSGLEDLSAALDTERTALSIEDSLTVARATELQAKIALWRATGGAPASEPGVSP